jgi:hypothetical protein
MPQSSRPGRTESAQSRPNRRRIQITAIGASEADPEAQVRVTVAVPGRPQNGADEDEREEPA